jgi:hypothetical protein
MSVSKDIFLELLYILPPDIVLLVKQKCIVKYVSPPFEIIFNYDFETGTLDIEKYKQFSLYKKIVDMKNGEIYINKINATENDLNHPMFIGFGTIKVLYSKWKRPDEFVGTDHIAIYIDGTLSIGQFFKRVHYELIENDKGGYIQYRHNLVYHYMYNDHLENGIFFVPGFNLLD